MTIIKTVFIRGKSMKALLITLLTLTSLTASAKTVRLFSIWDGFADDIQPEFMVNADLGRAWVNVVTVHEWDEEDDYNDNFIKVEGLSYNPNTKEVIYTEGNQEVVCAAYSARGRGIFRRTSLRNTNDCKFVVTKETRSVDDGFYVRTKKYEVVSLEINL